MNPKGICQKSFHAKYHINDPPNDSFMTINKLIIEAMKIGGCGGHITLMTIKPRYKTQMVEPWDHESNSQFLKIS